MGTEALKGAGDLGQAGTLFYAAGVGAFSEIHCGRFHVAEARVEELFALSEKYGLPFWSGSASCCGAASLSQLIGAIRRPLIGSAYRCWRRRGSRYSHPSALRGWPARTRHAAELLKQERPLRGARCSEQDESKMG